MLSLLRHEPLSFTPLLILRHYFIAILFTSLQRCRRYYFTPLLRHTTLQITATFHVIATIIVIENIITTMYSPPPLLLYAAP